MSVEWLMSVREKVLGGADLTFEEGLRLLDLDDAEVPYLAAIANEVRIRFNGNQVEMCALANAKSGNCSENCKFCSQSAHYKSDGPAYAMQSIEDLVAQAKEAESRGATEFCIVTSGWGQSDEKEFEHILEAVRRIAKETSVQVDCSLGFLTPDQMIRLKEAGVYRNNHNLEACEHFFEKVCSTHTYMQRANHVELVQTYGIQPCSGGILGMGETRRERLELAFALKKLNVDCLPINILNPRPGTPFEKLDPLEPAEIIKTIAVFRLAIPKCTIKIAGGREVNLRDLQAMAMQAGANGLILGNYLTTMGRDSAKDIQMLKDLGFDVKASAHLPRSSAVTAS